MTNKEGELQGYKTNKIDINLIKKNPKNPRIIRNDKFKKLVTSIKEFPQMLEVRPIVVDENMIVIGGNMRLSACLEANITEVPIIIFSGLTEDQKREFVVKDNANFGEWDWDILQTDWNIGELTDWGLDINSFEFELEDDEISESGLIENANTENDEGVDKKNTRGEELPVSVSLIIEKEMWFNGLNGEIEAIIKKYPNIICKIQS